MTETTDPQQAARDRLFALIASIPGSGGVDWCGKARALLNEIAAAPAAAPSAPADLAALREQIAEALYRREWPRKQVWVQALAMDRETFEAMADAVLAVLPANADRAAEWRAAADHLETLDPIEAALAGQHAWREAAETLRRAAAGQLPADEAQQPETQAEVVHACPPDGSGITPCCGRTPFELPRTDRMSVDSTLVICQPAAVSQPGKEA